MKVLKSAQFIKTLVLCLCIASFTSCSNKSESLKIIPKASNAVSVIDVYSLFKKGNLKDLENYNFFKSFKKEVRNENKKIARFMDGVMEDPKSTGIDFTNDFFMFFVDEAKDERYICMALDIENEAKFEAFIDELLDKSKIDYDLEQEDLYKYIINKDNAIAWDKNKALLLMAQNRSSVTNLDLQIETLFELKTSNQITSNEKFNDFFNQKKDVSFWLSTNILESMPDFKQLKKAFKKEFNFNVRDNYFTAHLNFDNEAIVVNTKLFPNADLKALTEKYNAFEHTFNTETLKYLPKQSFANTSLSIKPLEYYKLLKSEDDLDEFEVKFNEKLGFELEDFVSSFKGTALLSLIDFDEVDYSYKESIRVYNKKKHKYYNSWSDEYDYRGGYEYKDTLKTKTTTLPIIGLVFDLNSDKYLKKLLNKIPDDELENRNGYYEFKFDDSYPAYFAFNDKIAVITNHKKSIKNFKTGGLKTSSLVDSDKASSFTSNAYYAYMNLDYKDYPKEIKKRLKELQSSKEEKLFNTWNGFSKSMEINMVNDDSFEFIFTTKSKDNNSLTALLKLMDDSFENYSSF